MALFLDSKMIFSKFILRLKILFLFWEGRQFCRAALQQRPSVNGRSHRPVARKFRLQFYSYAGLTRYLSRFVAHELLGDWNFQAPTLEVKGTQSKGTGTGHALGKVKSVRWSLCQNAFCLGIPCETHDSESWPSDWTLGKNFLFILSGEKNGVKPGPKMWPTLCTIILGCRYFNKRRTWTKCFI